MAEAAVTSCCGDLARVDKSYHGVSVATHPLSPYLFFREPRKRELRAATGESPIQSSSAPTRVPRIFLGLGVAHTKLWLKPHLRTYHHNLRYHSEPVMREKREA
jgi:hypothetical protein